MHRLNLRYKIFMHIGPPSFVLFVKSVAKCLARQIEGTEKEVGLLGFQQVKQISSKSVDGIDWLAARAGHIWNGMEHLVDQRVGINHPNGLAGQAFGRRS